MAHNYNSQVIKKTKEFLPLNQNGEDKLTFGERLLTCTKRALRLVNQKEMAIRMSVSEATISMWLSGAKDIPLARQFEILKQAKCFRKEQRDIEDHIDSLMLMQFGKVDT